MLNGVESNAMSMSPAEDMLVRRLGEEMSCLAPFPAVRVEFRSAAEARVVIKDGAIPPGTPTREAAFSIDEPSSGKLLVSVPANAGVPPELLEIALRAILEKIEVEKREELLLNELSASWESLEVLYDISTDVLRFGDVAIALKRLTDRICSMQEGLEACLFVADGGRLVAVAGSCDLPPAIVWEELGPLQGALRNGRSILMNDPPSWPEDPAFSWRQGTCIAAAPVTSRQQAAIGVLIVWRNDRRTLFDAPFSRFLEAIAYQASMLLESDRLNRAMRENERLAQEIEIASSIQQTLLFGNPPVGLPSLEIASFSAASQRIDGDFHDFFEHDGVLDVLIGDVMGKGVAAALLGAATKNQFLCTIANLAIQSGGAPSPVDIVRGAASRIGERLLALERFVTLCYARFDIPRACVEFVDCGHTGILVHRKRTGETFFLRGDDLPLGVSLKERPSQHSAPVMPGDTLLLFSDGVTETRNPDGEIFGDERLIDCVETWSSLGPAVLLRQIQSLTGNFRQGASQTDDFTCIAVRIQAGPEDAPLSHSAAEFCCDIDQISGLREWLAQSAAGMSESDVARIETAITEVFVNCVLHGSESECRYPVHVDVITFESHLKIEIRHRGPAFDPLSIPPPAFDGSRDGGFGTFIVMRTADELVYQREGERNLISFSILRASN